MASFEEIVSAAQSTRESNLASTQANFAQANQTTREIGGGLGVFGRGANWILIVIVAVAIIVLLISMRK